MAALVGLSGASRSFDLVAIAVAAGYARVLASAPWSLYINQGPRMTYPPAPLRASPPTATAAASPLNDSSGGRSIEMLQVTAS